VWWRPFGKRFTTSGGNPARRDPTFQQRTYDEGLGIYDYRNRSFDPATGRFLQRDPVIGGDTLYNPYVFPGNNPVGNVDPMGTDKKEKEKEKKKGPKSAKPNKPQVGTATFFTDVKKHLKKSGGTVYLTTFSEVKGKEDFHLMVFAITKQSKLAVRKAIKKGFASPQERASDVAKRSQGYEILVNAPFFSGNKLKGTVISKGRKVPESTSKPKHYYVAQRQDRKIVFGTGDPAAPADPNKIKPTEFVTAIGGLYLDRSPTKPLNKQRQAELRKKLNYLTTDGVLYLGFDVQTQMAFIFGRAKTVGQKFLGGTRKADIVKLLLTMERSGADYLLRLDAGTSVAMYVKKDKSKKLALIAEGARQSKKILGFGGVVPYYALFELDPKR